MRRNVLCEEIYCSCKEIKCFMWRDLIRYFLYLNYDNLIRRKLRVKKNELSQYNNNLFQIIINKIFIYGKCENKCYSFIATNRTHNLSKNI